MGKAEEQIVVLPYNPEWKSAFCKEEERLRQYLNGEYKSIIHIGSTSIEGMVAKPIIDISIAVCELKDKAFYEEKLSPIGYKHCNGSKFENWILLDKNDYRQDYHVHLMPYDSMRLFKQVLFKIFLEENPDAADLYARKKKAFLVLDEHIWYSMNKKPFVDEVNLYALLDAIENPIFWAERVANIMGYIPYAELFAVEEKGKKLAQFEIAYRLLKDNRPIDLIMKATELTRKEIDYLL